MKIVICSSIFAVLLASACGSSSPRNPEAASAEQNHSQEVFIAQDSQGIRTATVEPSSIPDYLDIPARIVADPTRVVHVFPPAGGRVLEMKVRPWDEVHKGQRLALIESSDVSRALADYRKARTDAQLKKKNLERADDLLAHHAIAVKDSEEAQADAQSAEDEEKTTLEQLRTLGVDPAADSDQLQISAPQNGVILDIGSAPGEFSKSLDAPQPLCTIADLDSVWVEGQIFEKDLAILKTGARAEITVNAYPGQKLTGRVSVIGDAVDPVTRTLTVRVILPNHDLRLKPDMFATIRLVRSTTQGILVPATAVEREGQTAYVFVKKADHGFERHQVTLGETLGENIEVTSGIAAGNIIVSEGVVLMRAASQE